MMNNKSQDRLSDLQAKVKVILVSLLGEDISVLIPDLEKREELYSECGEFIDAENLMMDKVLDLIFTSSKKLNPNQLLKAKEFSTEIMRDFNASITPIMIIRSYKDNLDELLYDSTDSVAVINKLNEAGFTVGIDLSKRRFPLSNEVHAQY